MLFRFNKRNVVQFKDVSTKDRDLTGKTVVFTGGTDGMGRLALDKFASLGVSKLMVLGRNEKKTKAVVDAINNNATTKATPNGPIARYVHYDMSQLLSVHEAAKQVLKECSTIDILVNCAGANFDRRWTTDDDMECNWGVNHLAGFLLTQLLLDRLKKSAPSRIVHLSSATESYGHIHLDDIQLENTSWSTFKGYTQAKLAMNMCTRKLAKELEGTKVTVNALNPGFIRTSLVRDLTGLKRIGQIMMNLGVAESADVGADRILTLAIASQYDGVSGEYVYEDHIRDPNKEALDDELVNKVWDLSFQHVGLTKN